jgi:hypothetical protein
LALSRRFNVSTDSIYRHRKLHLSPQLRAKLMLGGDTEVDLDRLREVESQSLLSHLVSLRQRLFASFDYAEEMGDTHLLVRLSSQIHENLQIVGKLLGELNVGHQTTNILIAPQYVSLRVELVRALSAFPEARAAVAQVLHQIESTAAAQISVDGRRLAS